MYGALCIYGHIAKECFSFITAHNNNSLQKRAKANSAQREHGRASRLTGIRERELEGAGEKEEAEWEETGKEGGKPKSWSLLYIEGGC